MDTPTTKFEPSEELSDEQFKQYFDSFPDIAQQAIIRTSRNPTRKVSDKKLERLIEEYLIRDNDEHRSCTDGECAK